MDPAKLKSYSLTLQQVFTALANGNTNAGGSYVEHGSELYVVRGLGAGARPRRHRGHRGGHSQRHAHSHQRHRRGA